MKPVFVESFNIVSPLGSTAMENYRNVVAGISGVKAITGSQIDSATHYTALFDKNIQTENDFTLYESLIVSSVNEALSQTEIDPAAPDTLFVFSTTKGNISLLDETENPDDISLAVSAEKIAQHYKNKNKPVVISNACISGVVALIYAKRLLEAGSYKNIVVTGADCISKFIHSGFQSFMALSEGACKPFSASRDGINLGEAAATIILASEQNSKKTDCIQLLGGSVTNDANHISGPSRTGEELSGAIKKAMELSQIKPGDLGFISAHGTATLFNDEMEARAFNLSGMRNIPVNSLKGYFGHTLGAAGLVESVISMIGLQKGEIIPTKGFAYPVVQPIIEIASELIQDREMKYCLKTASGFGGCNAALVFSKS